MNPGASRLGGVAAWPSQIIDDYRSACRRGDAPNLERYWSVRAQDARPETLAALSVLIKEDLRRRYALGERPAVADYLDRFPVLRDHHDRMISLVYEEFCLREDHGERPDPDSFCQRYEPWRDSLLLQLRFHDEVSQLASTPRRAMHFPEPGECFRKFRLCSELGRGGVARVYLARDDQLGGRKYALKLSPDHGEEPSIQGRLDHPHIVAVTHVEYEPETGLRGLFMPYWPGLPLNQVIDRIDPARARPRTSKALWFSLGAPVGDEQEIEKAGRPDWKDYPHRGSHADAVAWVGLKLAEALAHAHARGIIHRDIKPANILLTRRGGPLLLDFNLAHASSHAEEADTASRGGTLPYMAPEHLRAFLHPETWDQVRPQADLYSLGLVLRELLVGEPPPTPALGLSANRAVHEMLDIREGPPPAPLRGLSPSIPHALEAILARCLSPAPADRYPDADSLVEDLRRLLERRPLAFARNPSRSERLRNWVYRHRSLLAPVLLCVAVTPLIYGGTLTLNPGTSYMGLVNLGSHNATQARHEQAMSYFQKALKRNPNGYEAHQGLAAILVNLEEYEASVSHYMKAIAQAEKSGLDPLKCARLHRDAALTLAEWSFDLRERSVDEYQERNLFAGPAEEYGKQSDDRCLRALIEIKKADVELDLAELAGADSDQVRQVHCNLLVLSAQLHKRRGEIASLGDHYQESVPLFQKAKELIANADEIRTQLLTKSLQYRNSLPSEDTINKLVHNIDENLETDIEQLAKRESTAPLSEE